MIYTFVLYFTSSGIICGLEVGEALGVEEAEEEGCVFVELEAIIRVQALQSFSKEREKEGAVLFFAGVVPQPSAGCEVDLAS